MNVDYLLLVIDSVEDFFNENFSLSLKRKEMELHQSFSSSVGEGIFLDLVGDVEGRIILTYSDQFKEFLLNILLEGFDLSLQEDYEFREAALKELLNQLSGFIVTKMTEKGYHWDIGVPHFFEKWEERRRRYRTQLEAVEIPYFIEDVGDMKIRVAMEEKNSWLKEDVG